MQNINSELYRTNIFYRDLVDKMLANEKEQKIRQLELEQQLRQRQAECERLQAELDFRKSRVFGYANQIPYQSMTPISQTQYKSTFSDIQNNFVRYWSASIQKPPSKPQLTAEQQEQIRRVFHSAISAVAHFSKPSAPIASLVFDGLGIMTAGNLLDAAKTAASIADTIDQLTTTDLKNYQNNKKVKLRTRRQHREKNSPEAHTVYLWAVSSIFYLLFRYTAMRSTKYAAFSICAAVSALEITKKSS